MQGNMRFITEVFHRNNYTKTALASFSTNYDFNYIYNQPDENKIMTLTNLHPGLYITMYNNRIFNFLIDRQFTENDKYIIEDEHNSYYLINGTEKVMNHIYRLRAIGDSKVSNTGNAAYASLTSLQSPLQNQFSDISFSKYVSDNNSDNISNVLAFQLQANLDTSYYTDPDKVGPDITETMDFNNILQMPLQGVLGSLEDDGTYYIIPNTVNSYFDGIVLKGYTESVEQETKNPLHVSNEPSISTINIISSSTKDYSTKETYTVNIKTTIKKLRSGVSDLLIIDALRSEAYVINRIGTLVLTGNENWTVKYSNDRFCVFFLKYDLVQYGENDTSINCNYFPTVTCSEMLKDDTRNYCISNNNSSLESGIFIRIPLSVINLPTVYSFKKYLAERFRDNPVTVDYLLKKEKVKNVYLNDYKIKSFYPDTRIAIDYITDFTLLSKNYK